jgi:hypothetical protein
MTFACFLGREGCLLLEFIFSFHTRTPTAQGGTLAQLPAGCERIQPPSRLLLPHPTGSIPPAHLRGAEQQARPGSRLLQRIDGHGAGAPRRGAAPAPPHRCGGRAGTSAAVPVPGPEQLLGAARRRVGWGRRAGGERGRGQVCRILLLSCRVLPARGSVDPRRQPLPLPAIHPQCRDLPLPVAVACHRVTASAWYVIRGALLLPIFSTWLM